MAKTLGDGHENLLPPQAHVLAGQIEDALHVWQRRQSPFHKVFEEQAERTIVLCGDLIVVIGSMRDQVHDELVKYRKGSVE